MAEVEATPASGQFQADYSTGADGQSDWNTGTIQFNSADAGKTVAITYVGTGSLANVRNMRGLHRCDIFTASGEWTCPSGVSRVNILVFGGGGAGSGRSGSTNVVGTDGGSSSFGSLLTAGGGQRALIGTTAAKRGAISASPETILLGLPPLSPLSPFYVALFYAGTIAQDGGSSGGDGEDANGYGNSGGNASGLGNGAMANQDGIAGATSTSMGSSAGGGVLYAVAVPVAEGTSYNITIGAGGVGGNGTSYDGGDGAPGIVIIWY